MFCSLSMNWEMLSITRSIAGRISSPSVCAYSTALFFRLVSLLARVLYFFAAIVSSAVFSRQASFAISCARAKSSLALVARSRVSRRRISEMPISFRVLTADAPSSSSFPRPSMNFWNTCTGSLSHCSTNSFSVRPDTIAKSFRASPPVRAATSMLIRALDIDEPPAWALIPTEDSAAARPSTCASVRPICLPAPAMRMAIVTMGSSVVAKLLPSSATVEPMFLNSDWSVFMMLANLARLVAAVSASRSVLLFARSVMTRENSSMCSVAMPS